MQIHGKLFYASGHNPVYLVLLLNLFHFGHCEHFQLPPVFLTHTPVIVDAFIFQALSYFLALQHASSHILYQF